MKKVILILFPFISVLVGCNSDCPHTNTSEKQERISNPTCKEEGSYDLVTYCTDCNAVISTEHKLISKLEHTEVIDKGYEATFLNDGLTDGSHCSVCGEIIEQQQIIPKLNYEDYAFCCNFNDNEHVTISVYESKDYNVDPVLTNVAYSRDDNGNPTKNGDGQINFLINVDDGFIIENIRIDGNYKNLKGPEDTKKENVYRITKINSDLTITVEVTEETLSPISFSTDEGLEIIEGEFNKINKTQEFEVKYKKYFINDELQITSNDGALLENIGENKFLIKNITEKTSISVRSVCEFVDTQVGASINDSNELILNWSNLTDRFESISAIIIHNGFTEEIDLTEADKTETRIYNYGKIEDHLYKVGFKILTKGGKTLSTFLNNFLYPKNEVANTGLSYLNICTENNVFPYTHYIDHPVGQNGKSLIDNDYVQANISLYNQNGDLVYQSAEENCFNNAKIKARGNTSAYADKKPLKIKLSKAYDMLEELIPGRKENSLNFKNKEWVLLRQTDLKQLCGTSISRAAGLEFSPSGIFINLIINGAYKGMYLLSESVNKGNGEGENQSRLKISDTGFIIENDAYWWNESLYMKTAINSSQERWTFKYPDSDDITTDSEEYLYIQSYLNTFEPYIIEKNDTAFEYLDMNSFVSWSIARLVVASADPAGTNMYLCKYDNTSESKAYAGLIWDFDNCFKEERVNKLDTIFSSTRYYAKYLIEMPTFLNALKDRFYDCVDKMVEQFQNDIVLLDMTGYDASIDLDNKCWGESSVFLQTNINVLVDWLNRHIAFLKTKF